MPQNQERLAKLLGKAVNQLVTSGDSVRIDGLGTFVPGADGDPDFLPDTDARIFIAYSKEDVHHADRLYEDLLEAGFNPWLDHKKLLAGQNWARSIDRAIETSDFFVACYSSQSTVKRGRFQSEVRTALRCSDEMPLDDLFF
ncbi:MAG TPA: toll/interleukin-1 receptor domain-containing protein, partial [Bryobacteraceae bacterium]|nr:toll/interleukin-1 receptor domain-containing protein [Bryobacteraceae bacterium]